MDGGRRVALFAERGWYPRDPDALAAFLAEACPPGEAAGATAVISPHAGYRYSGRVAGQAFAQVEVPGVAVVIGIGHRPAPRPNVIGVSGLWETPLGPVPIAAELARAILDATDILVEDMGEQAGEHSLELQLPFLKHRNPDVRIVPIQVCELTERRCRGLGEAIAGVLSKWPEPALIVASTDLHHQGAEPGVDPPAVVPVKDLVAIERIAAFDPEGLYADVRREGVTMCGLLPTTTALHAARALGATSVRAVAHATSYEVSGSSDYVVGYLSAVVT